MNIATFLSGLRARYRTFLGILSVTVLAALLVSLLMPKTYVAQTSIMSDLKNEQSLNPGQQYFNDRERTSYLQTQVDILTSPKVARQVVRDLDLAKNPVLLAAYKDSEARISFDDWMGELLLSGLKVDTSLSNIIKLSYASGDPVQAARYANGFAQAYIGSVLELRVEPLKQASAWFVGQAQALRTDLEAAEARLTEFERQNGILAADERNDMATLHLVDLAGQAARTRETAAANDYLEATMRDTRSVETLRNNLALANAKLLELSEVYGDRHPNVIRQRAEVAALSSQLQSEMKVATADAERSLRAARQRSISLQADVAAQSQRVGDLHQAHARLAILRNDFANAQRAYDQAMQRSVASAIDSRAVVANVSVLSEAMPPASAKSPKLGLNIVLALVIGTLLGLSAVYFLEASDRRLRLVDDFADYPMVPLLAVLNANDSASVRLLPDRSAASYPTFPRAIPGPR